MDSDAKIFDVFGISVLKIRLNRLMFYSFNWKLISLLIGFIPIVFYSHWAGLNWDKEYDQIGLIFTF